MDISKSQRQHEATICKKYLPLVYSIGFRLLSRFPFTLLSDDILQSGMIGLIDASRKYDEASGNCFATYAHIRIRGEMLDEIRRFDWTPRSMYRTMRSIAAAISALEQHHGREARGHEIADHLGVTLNQYHEIIAKHTTSRLMDLEDHADIDDTVLSPREKSQSPEEMAELEEMYEHIDALPGKEPDAIKGYYLNGMLLREVGSFLGVSESRACQICTSGVDHLRRKMVH